jgi:hypothetical protein
MRTCLAAMVAVAAVTTACTTPKPNMTTATYDPTTGQLTTLTADADGDGRVDTVSRMEGTRILRIELDLDENGQVERWDFYRADGTLEKVGLSHQNDGVMDAVAFYDEGGVLTRMNLSTRRDGTFDRAEYYADGRLSRSEDDINGDGRPDKWDVFEPVPGDDRTTSGYRILSTAFDDAGRGWPQRRWVYGAQGRVVRVERDDDGDGTFEAVER